MANNPKLDTLGACLDFYEHKCLLHLTRTMSLYRVVVEQQGVLSDLYRGQLVELLPGAELPENHRLVEDFTKQSLSNLKTDFEFFLWKLAWIGTYFRLESVLSDAVLKEECSKKIKEVFERLDRSKLSDELVGSGGGCPSLDEMETRSRVTDLLVPQSGFGRLGAYLSRVLSADLKEASEESYAQVFGKTEPCPHWRRSYVCT